MKKIFSLTSLLVFASFCSAQNGVIGGTVFFKYNDFIGSRPDAGAQVTIFPLSKEGSKTETLVDLKGEFLISKLDSGSYLTVIKSKETKSDVYVSFMSLLIYAKTFQKYFSIDISDCNPSLVKEIEALYKEYMDYLISGRAKGKKIVEYKSEIMKKVYKFYGESKIIDLTLKLGISLPSEKIHFEEVKIKEEIPSKIIVDFGITYN